MSSNLENFTIKGFVAAPFQPFFDNGEVDYDSIANHVEEVISQGCSYAFVAGTTGEGVTMSVAERKQVLERWIQYSNNRIGIIAHVGSESISDVKELTIHARDAGAVAISAMPSTFFKPDSIDAIISYFEIISECAPSIPLYYYHLAIKTGVHIRCDKLLERVNEVQAEGRLLNFRGIKYSDADLHIAANCVAVANKKYNILYGKDEQFLGAYLMGIRGAVGSTYNYMGRVFNNLVKCVEAGDLSGALEEQRKGQEVVNLLMQGSKYGHGAANVGKAIMKQRLGGKHCGPPRTPGVAVSKTDVLRADLEALGFFQW